MKLFGLMVEVMFPLALLVGAGALWPLIFRDTQAEIMNSPPGEPEHAASLEAATPAMMTAPLLADRFRLDGAAAALLIGWSTILFWIGLPRILALGLIG
jgi:hypothetical protein